MEFLGIVGAKGDPDTRLDHDVVAFQMQRSGDRLQDAPGDVRGIFAIVDLTQQDRELVAPEPGHGRGAAGQADAGDGIAAAQAAGQTLGERLEQTVAARVTQRVVDPLEAVEIEEQHGQLAALATDLCDRFVEHLPKMRPVRQTGDAVEERQLANPLLLQLALAIVLGDADHGPDRAIGRAHQSPGHHHRDRLPRAIAILGFDMIQAAFPLQAPDQIGRRRHRPWRRAQQPIEEHAVQLALRIAQETIERAIGEADPAVRGEHRERLRHRLQNVGHVVARDRGRLQPVQHSVEGIGQHAQLVAAADRDVRVHAPERDRLRALDELGERPGDPAQNDERQQERDRQKPQRKREVAIAHGNEIGEHLPIRQAEPHGADQIEAEKHRRGEVQAVIVAA